MLKLFFKITKHLHWNTLYNILLCLISTTHLVDQTADLSSLKVVKLYSAMTLFRSLKSNLSPMYNGNTVYTQTGTSVELNDSVLYPHLIVNKPQYPKGSSFWRKKTMRMVPREESAAQDWTVGSLEPSELGCLLAGVLLFNCLPVKFLFTGSPWLMSVIEVEFTVVNSCLSLSGSSQHWAKLSKQGNRKVNAASSS